MTPAPELLGTYAPPAVRVGGRLYCHYRRAWCTVTGRSAAPVPWPKGRPDASRGKPGVIVTAAMEAAVRRESVAAIAHWFGVSPQTVSKWRRVLGVRGFETVGSHRLHARGIAAGRSGRKRPG